jgi:hypothetical protein
VEISDAIAGGIIGALIGSGLTLAAQWWHGRNQRRGAGRALRAEMEGNQLVLVTAADGSFPIAQLSNATWLNVQTEIALLLPRNEFRTISALYGLMPLHAKVLAEAQARGSVHPRDKSEIERAAAVFAEASITLAGHDKPNPVESLRERIRLERA